MPRHLTDHARTKDTRAENFTRIERKEGEAGPHDTATTLQRRATTPPEDSKRTAAFARVERGHRS